MFITIYKINNNAYNTPNNKSNPCKCWQIIHQITTTKHSHWPNNVNCWTFKTSFYLRTCNTQIQYPKASYKNADKVPIFAISAITLIGTNPAIKETKIQPPMVTKYGV